ncbi:MAG TPA: hypothetical protein VK116_09345, partial [Planctomycetota bacterium]|nr:hypothetical protein [Planctomycetota bacterium]
VWGVVRICVDVRGVVRIWPDVWGVVRICVDVRGVVRICVETRGVARIGVVVRGVDRTLPVDTRGVADRTLPVDTRGAVERTLGDREGVDRTLGERDGAERTLGERDGEDRTLGEGEGDERTLAPREAPPDRADAPRELRLPARIWASAVSVTRTALETIATTTQSHRRLKRLLGEVIGHLRGAQKERRGREEPPRVRARRRVEARRNHAAEALISIEDPGSPLHEGPGARPRPRAA